MSPDETTAATPEENVEAEAQAAEDAVEADAVEDAPAEAAE